MMGVDKTHNWESLNKQEQSHWPYQVMVII